MSTTAFPLRLPYADKGYHQILTTSLFEGTPLVKWSKKVAQWNSKLNGFCYLKCFTRKSRATIANCLGPFPKGSEIRSFLAFEHNNAKDIITDTTSPRTYHYRWLHECALGPPYCGRPDYQGSYGGDLDTMRFRCGQAIHLARSLGLPWKHLITHLTEAGPPLAKLTTEEKGALLIRKACFRCREDRHRSKDCPKRKRPAEYGRPAPTLPTRDNVIRPSMMRLLRKVRTLSTEEREELIVEFMTTGLTRTQTRTCLSMYRDTPSNEEFQVNLETSLKHGTCTPKGDMPPRKPNEEQVCDLVERLKGLLTSQEAKQRYLDLVIERGFCLAPELATLGQALRLWTIY
jgi:hypothetical protein